MQLTAGKGSTSSICPRCAQPLLCGVDDTQCWCQEKKPLLSSYQPTEAARMACLCPACLDALLEQQHVQKVGKEQ
jgi:Cysteine-rich CWC